MWNPAGFPSIDYDEGVYMRKAMHILNGYGVQELYNSYVPYEQPYFGLIFLAGLLKIIGYPYSLPISPQSFELLYMIPRHLMGILAVVSTFLIFKISEKYYNTKIAFIAAMLFAVTPSTWLLRGIWLESIQLPFLLCSILFALYSKNSRKFLFTVSKIRINNNNLLIILSGFFLGLAIFTKIPAFTLIPLIGFLIYKSNKSLKTLGVWFIPVLTLPLIWPVYAISVGQWDNWIYGVNYQTHREENNPLHYTLYDFMKIDPVLPILGAAGFLFAAIKKDLFVLLWFIPFLLFLYLIGYVGDLFNLIPVIPASCIAGGSLVYYVCRRINNENAQRIMYLGIFFVIAVFGLINASLLIIQNVNSAKFEAGAFVSHYLNKSATRNISIISNPLYLWIPQHVYHYTEFDYVPYDGMSLVKNDDVISIIDNKILFDAKYKEKLAKIINLFDQNSSRMIKFWNSQKDTVSIIPAKISSAMINQTDALDLIDINHVWEPFNSATILQNNNTLRILVNGNNNTDIYSGASLKTKIDSKNVLLLLEYSSRSSTGKGTFYAEVNVVNKNSKSGLDNLVETYYVQLKKSNNTINWKYPLMNTYGHSESETFIFPKFSSLTESHSNKQNYSVELRILVKPDGIGEYKINITNIKVL